MKETKTQFIKRLNKSTLNVKKVGKKYRVRDVVEFDGNYGLLTFKQLKKKFK